jgi:hypothetical protein
MRFSLLVVFAIICGLTVALWVRSHTYQDRWWPQTAAGGRKVEVTSKVGGLLLSVEPSRFDRPSLWESRRLNEGLDAEPTWSNEIYSRSHLGFVWETEAAGFRYHPMADFYTSSHPTDSVLIATMRRERGTRHKVLVPYWTVAVATGAWPLWSLGCRILARPRAGKCHTCGYDLRASTDRCPECGTAISAKSSTVEKAGPKSA